MSNGKAPVTHVAFDEAGRAVLAGSTTKVVEVVLDHLAHGWSPEEIFLQHDRVLSLAQIHAALAYYYENQAAFDAEIERQLRDSAERRSRQAGSSPFRRRLLASDEPR